jgi:cytochrome c-type biogenesis protein CcmH/NrfG
MAKKKQADKRKTTETKAQGKYVRMETAIIVALVALVVGFFGGEIIDFSKPRTGAGIQTSTPSSPRVPQMPAAAAPFAGQNSARMLELEKEVALNPGKAEAWTELGNLYFDGRQVQQAIGAYKKSVELNPYDPNVLTDLGVMYRRNGQPFEAIAAFRKAAGISPRHEQSRFNIGIVFMHDLDDPEGAIKAWEELLKVNPSANAGKGETVRDLVDGLKRKLKEKESS